MNLNHLHYFYMVAKHGSFSRAARELRVSQSSISVQIKQLEAALGHTLFTRIKSGVELTESGGVVFECAESIFHDLERLEDTLEAMQRTPSGTVTVGTVNSIGIYVLPGLLRAFNAQYPEVKVGIHVSTPRELVEGVRMNKVDFAVLTTGREYTGLTRVPLRRDKMFLVAPPAHELAQKASVLPSDLEKYPFLGFEEGMESRMMMDALFRRMKLSVEYTMETSNVATIKHMVMAGLGLAILPETVVGDEIRRGRLVRPHVPSLYMLQEITVYHKENRNLTPARREFLAALRREMAETRPVKR